VDGTCIQSKILKLVVINLILTCFFFSLSHDSRAMGFNPLPTVTVIDDETGKPIEGAVAIAIWRKTSDTEGAWFEGGKFEVLRIEEEVSDSNGNIFIDGFWNWHLIEERYPHLTIYKPGYVCWDQSSIYLGELQRATRTDFDKNHRSARMRKWPEGFSFVGHNSFVNSATQNDYTDALKKLFLKAYDYERLFRIKENTETDKKRKEIEELKRREVQ
jgi:hypothetical protein